MVELIKSVTWEQIGEVMQADPEITIGIAGPPGLGKTSFAFEIADLMEKDYVGKVQCHDELSPSEIMGVLVPGERGSEWIPGPGDLAYSQGGLLILDEIDKLSGPCKTYAYGLLDKGPGGTISYLGRTFTQCEGYQVIATMNDDPNSGILPEALLDRFDAWFFVTEPRPQLYAMLDDKLARHCKRMYSRVRDKMVGPDFTFRQFLALQRLVEVLPLDQAILSACRGNQPLARSLYESLTIGHKDDDDDSNAPEA